MTIIITGGAGFIGSHVVRLFVNKYSEYRIINVDVPLGLELGDTELLGEEETAEGTDGHTDGADEELVELGALGDEEDGSRRDDERHDLLEAEGLLVGVGAVAGHVHGAVAESLEETMGIISMVSARS